jgi:hypothetical protein
VYLHRYNESTLARMRTEYVMPLISKMAAMVILYKVKSKTVILLLKSNVKRKTAKLA